MSEKNNVLSNCPELDDLKDLLAKEKKIAKRSRMIFAAVFIAMAAALVIIIVSALWSPVVRVTGDSMEPTLSEGQLLVVKKNADVEPGDIVALNQGRKLLIKRVIAVGGSQVEIDEDGAVSVDGKMLEESYVAEPALGECNIQFPCDVPERFCFVMGDKRDTSVDSRNTAMGLVNEEQIIGRVQSCLWPLSKCGAVNK